MVSTSTINDRGAGAGASAGASASAGGERIEQFDGLRALAFLSVFAHHALHVPLLWMGVDMFFVLSGFLITRNLLGLRSDASGKASTTVGNALRIFFVRRVARILPPYYLALAAAFAVAGVPDGAAWFLTFTSNIHDALYGHIDGPLHAMWSIAVEEQFYVVWPWIVLLAPRAALRWIFVAIVVAAPVCRFLFTPQGIDAVYRLTLCRMDLLALGALLALADEAALLRAWSRRAVLLAAVAVVLFGACTVALPTFRTSNNDVVFNVVGFALSSMFFTSAFVVVRTLDASSTNPLQRIAWRVLMNPVLRFVGQVSYMAYLLHLLAIEIAKLAGLRGPSGAALALVLTLAGATASWFVVEKPLQRVARERTSRKVAP